MLASALDAFAGKILYSFFFFSFFFRLTSKKNDNRIKISLKSSPKHTLRFRRIYARYKLCDIKKDHPFPHDVITIEIIFYLKV